MRCAEGISCTAVRASKPWDALRQQLHKRFAQWLDTLEPQLHEPSPTVSQVSDTVWGLRQSLTGGITETMVKQAHEGDRQRTPARCPRCTRVLKVQEHVWRTVETMVGPVELERPYFSCRSCRAGLSPLDDALGLVAGCQQRERHHAAATLGTAVPYDTAQARLSALTGRHCGSARMHPFTNPAGAELTVLAVAPSRQESERRLASVSAGRLRRPVLVLGIDGAAVPTRPDRARAPCQGRRGKRAQRARGQWRDAQGLRFSLLDGERIVPGRSGHQGQNAAPLGAARTQIQEAGVMPAAQGRLCVVCDGAEWRGKHVQAWFPQARQGRDSSHCAQSLHRVAKAHYGASVQA